MSRRQAFSAGLVAGAFFSSGCTDEEQPGGPASDADVTDLAGAEDSIAFETWTPIVTALPDERLQEPARPGAKVRVVRPRVHKPEPALAVPPHLIIESIAETEAAEASASGTPAPHLDRQTMLGDSYAAFGANALP